MGQLDQFAKEMLASETWKATGGAVTYARPIELTLSDVRLDGLLKVLAPVHLARLPAPWSLASAIDNEIVLEVKMQGDHSGMVEVYRAELRRQTRQVQRAEDTKSPWDGDESLWFATSHLPKILPARRTVERVAPGCYRVGPASFPFVWIAANELPLMDELIPFLIARSGRALDEFGRWVKTRRPPEWVMHVVEFLPMSTAVYDELIRFAAIETADPGIQARRAHAAEVLLEVAPEVRDKVRQEGVDVGRLAQARAALRSVLERRGLVLSSEEQARIETCAVLEMLERWHDQAIDAKSAEEALR